LAGQIRITPNQIRERANEYRVQREALEDVVNKMDNLLTALQNEWEGATANAYYARYKELRPSFIEAQNLINDIALKLDNTASSIETIDSEIASIFSAES